MLERKSSIETEPVTLHLNQMRHAREAAMLVLQTKTMEEAMNIFTQGLEAVREKKRGGGCNVELDDDDDYDLQLMRQRLVENAYRDTVSAPF
ncbi:PREDICTED: uncharacterized protein LOC104819498 [Tarenaya hassleriana]|uniref:uncharacterized protein LOC104819498 n=1 Tax=Tarenaya hassleriana TaxID=28532 RepID=UPI00053C226F|nr:PREDICTED: uncharacterized protein LOC104819498 [Tarenaya hassleriana]